MGIICVVPVTFTTKDKTCLSDLAVDIPRQANILQASLFEGYPSWRNPLFYELTQQFILGCNVLPV